MGAMYLNPHNSVLTFTTESLTLFTFISKAVLYWDRRERGRGREGERERGGDRERDIKN